MLIPHPVASREGDQRCRCAGPAEATPGHGAVALSGGPSDGIMTPLPMVIFFLEVVACHVRVNFP